ncbi:MarR family transcriptional regulator [Pseudoalteromonas denitrificans]|uniref:DNA-binding transcriptional regulator, MarR family n=1 Tax=Pseudoalteromonas denitrificans DSM 6059 TaxID=1123010 RepID=A0A1I1N7E5_9GAMM|nr:MarR family transcriptional regulator [Pseudoalteromonas denitrificans]SFC90723.1 DNA-binding transcriptional regulator, MarR family [Pseudoalteromonas denitrificans DSM 6059]
MNWSLRQRMHIFLRLIKKMGLVQKEIYLALHLEKSTITRSIDKMVADGYLIRRASSENNQKEQSIFALRKAKKIENRLNEIDDELYANLPTKISKDDLTTLVVLERLISKKL